MPIPAYITFILNGKNLKGSVTFPGKEGTSEAHEFNHEVAFSEKDWFAGNVVRIHSPVEFIKPVDSISVSLYKILTCGLFIDKVLIDWTYYNEKNNTEEVYFQHILEKVKICSVSMFMHHVKNSRYEQYPHLEKITLRYDRIIWNILNGNIRFADRWKYAFLIPGMNINQQDEWDAIMEQDAVTDDMDEDEEEEVQEELQVSNPRWEHVDKTLKEESPDTAANGDAIKLMADIKGFVEKGKVTFDIYDISKNTPQRIDTVYGKNIEEKADAEWVVEDTRRETDTHKLKLAFEVSARSKYSERKDIGFREKITGLSGAQFIDKMGESLKNLDCSITLNGDEIFNGQLSDGSFVLENIPAAEIEAIVTYEDSTYSFGIPWNIRTKNIPTFLTLQRHLK